MREGAAGFARLAPNISKQTRQDATPLAKIMCRFREEPITYLIDRERIVSSIWKKKKEKRKSINTELNEIILQVKCNTRRLYRRLNIFFSVVKTFARWIFAYRENYLPCTEKYSYLQIDSVCLGAIISYDSREPFESIGISMRERSRCPSGNGSDRRRKSELETLDES
ncbi:hypothetical protein PUN28_017361 [Cardiocondyla obscurior]|uniref:Uncharacterized protein n=1 Tax=Cardiocondyla obscurior TaxID=286306 RepID=A0AAW2ERA2_9HYME